MTETKQTGLSLTIEEGENAYSVLSKASRALRNGGRVDHDVVFDDYEANAKSGDYDHLIAVTKEYFQVTVV